jgi:branched-chain amino acid transport system substrate-binding protein
VTKGSISRRSFVRGAGLGAAGLLVGSAAAAAPVGRSRPKQVRAGLLLSTDGSYARMSESFTDGFRLALHDANIEPSLVTRPLARGVDGAYAAAHELVSSNLDVLVATISSPLARLLAPLAEEASIPMIVANAGGHLDPPAPDNPFVLHNSLLYWQASYAMGTWLARSKRSAFIATSFADSGYDALFAFRAGFEAGGGSVVGSYVTHVEPEDTGLQAALDEIRRARPGVVYAFYSGPAALDFLRAYRAAGLSAPVTGPAFLAEDFGLKAAGRDAVGVKTASSWTHSDKNPANLTFVDAYARKTGRRADPFSVLGYDSATLIATGLAKTRSANRIVEALGGASFASPRGQLVVDPATHAVNGPLHVREVQRSLTGPANAVLTPLRSLPKTPDGLAGVGSCSSGYLNEILCA